MSFNWPNKLSNMANKSQRKVKLHGKSIMSIRVSSDLKYLITVAEDNSMSVCFITLVQNMKRL